MAKKGGGTLSVRTQINLRPLQKLITGLDKLEAIVEASMTDAMNEAGEPAVKKLQRPAPRRKKGVKVRWKSEKQRRYVLGFVLKKRKDGSIIPYKRTGKMRKAWEVTKNKTGNKISVGFRNRVPYARFVMGTLNLRSLDNAAKYQQPFHKDTGWNLAQPIVSEGLVSIEQAFEKALSRRLQQEFGILSKTRRSRSYNRSKN